MGIAEDFEDIVVPHGNEKELVEMAARLGYTSILLLYINPGDVDRKDRKISTGGIDVKKALVVSPENALPYLKSSKKRGMRIFIDSVEPSRFLMEKFRNLNFFNLESSPRKDFIHHRNSGLNHVLANLLHRNSHTVFISLSGLLSSHPIFMSRKIGRIMANIRLARKYRFSVKIASFASGPYQMRNPEDIRSFGRVLGMDTNQLKF